MRGSFGFLSAMRSILRRDRRRRQRSGQFSAEMLETRQLLTALQMTDNEQLLVELINRARMDPGGEAVRLDIDLNFGLVAGTLKPDPRQPLAPEQVLIDSAGAHAQDMLNRNYFSHYTAGSKNGPQERANARGYTGSVGENLSWGGSTEAINELEQVYDRHLNLWRSSVHRRNMLDDGYDEIGVGMRYGRYTSGPTYNASMAVTDFGRINAKPFITGVVFGDLDNDNFYDPGESVRAGTVAARNLSTGEVVVTDIGNSGGYALSVNPGSWLVSAEYLLDGVIAQQVHQVDVGAFNVKVDFNSQEVQPIQLTLTSSSAVINERGAGSSISVTATRAFPIGHAVTIQLLNSNSLEATLPTSVTIPAGAKSASVTMQAVADNVVDGTTSLTVSTAASGYAQASLKLSVADRTAPLLPTAVQVVATARPKFTWSAVDAASSYTIHIDNATTKQTRLLVVSGIRDTSFVPSVDLGIGTYNVWVRATTATGLLSTWSPVGVWQTRPVPVLQKVSVPQQNNTLNIGWLPVAGAASYDVWVDALSTGVKQYYRNMNVTGTSVSVPKTPVGRYQVWVRAKNAAGEQTGWGVPGNMLVTYVVTGVAVRAGDFTSTAELRWDRLSGAVAYDVWIDDRSTGVAQVLRNTKVSGTSLLLSALSPSSYTAWVRGRDLSGIWHAWSAPMHFEFKQPAVVLRPLPTTKERSPVVTWTAVAGVTSYQARLLNSDGDVLASATSLAGTSWTPSATLDSGEYRIWLKAIDFRGNSLTTEEYVFTVVSAEDAAGSESGLELLSQQLEQLTGQLDGQALAEPDKRAEVTARVLVSAELPLQAESVGMAARVVRGEVGLLVQGAGGRSEIERDGGTDARLLEQVFERVAGLEFEEQRVSI
jgi:hypothetical protein